MKMRITNMLIRSSIDIPFFIWPTNVTSYIFENYVSTGKCNESESHMSDDGLILTSVRTWTSVEDYYEYSTDPTVVPVRMDQTLHYLSYGVLQETRIERSVD